MHDIILERRVAPGLRQVAAVCGETGLEGVAFGPTCAAWSDLERLALAKLHKLMRSREARSSPESRGGVVV